jgi:hypothetical protein
MTIRLQEEVMRTFSLTVTAAAVLLSADFSFHGTPYSPIR